MTRYRTIVADPPWAYPAFAGTSRRATSTPTRKSHMKGTLPAPRTWAVRFPMTLYICPWCGSTLRAPDGLAPYFCEGTDGIDTHPRTEFERHVVTPAQEPA
jgi:hypothetical protein